MQDENKNLKDTSGGTDLALKDRQIAISYTKHNKLIIALYMVTDIMEKDEPLRIKLRTLAAEIVSDINSLPLNALAKVSQILSFLDIGGALNIISEMNSNILKKEFLKLEQSLKDFGKVRSIWLDDFLASPMEDVFDGVSNSKSFSKNNQKNSIGHNNLSRTREMGSIGVQKGSTLLKALSDRTARLSDSLEHKNSRRNDIIRVLKTNNSGLTITDIKTTAKGLTIPAEAITSCSEKTLQRELAGMVKEGLLTKSGEKRWSRYFVVKAS